MDPDAKFFEDLAIRDYHEGKAKLTKMREEYKLEREEKLELLNRKPPAFALKLDEA